MPEIVTAPELARRYHVTPRTICRWARAGILSAMRGSKRPLLFDLTASDEALRRIGAQRADGLAPGWWRLGLLGVVVMSCVGTCMATE